MKKTILISSLVVICVLLFEAYRENLNMGWQEYQRTYKNELVKRAATPGEKEIADAYKVKMRQVVLPELNRIDRCTICHVAMEDARMGDMLNPIKSHPGDIFENHELEKIGCTMCHDGQGRAITMTDAHARGEDKFWEKPMLSKPYLEANCYRCHSSTLEVTPQYKLGKTIFESKGCLGCHKLDGKGGIEGPDLTNLGNANFHVKMPTHENREHLLEEFEENVNLAYIYEAVKDPHAQPENSAMVDYKFTEEESIDLTVYLKSLTVGSVPENLIAKKLAEAPLTPLGRGEKLYGTYCVACHGVKGEGTHLPELTKIGPAISNSEFLSIADQKLLSHVVSFSRGGEMPAFATVAALTADEINDIVEYIQSFKKTPPSFEEVNAIDGNAQYGRTFFQGNCSSCHGIDGTYSKDLIGPTLNNPTLLSLATKKFWYEAIVRGRSHTAMPAWHFLDKHQIADLIAYLEDLKPPVLNKEETMVKLWTDPSIENGKKLFDGQCAVCHGADGFGAFGPNLNNAEFDKYAGSEFIFEVMVNGRAGTAMPSWNFLSEEQAADIIAYIMSWHDEDTVQLSDERIRGSEREGEKVFTRACAQCHGLGRGSTVAPAILSEGFLSQASDQYIKVMTMYGRSHTQMRPALKGQGGISELSHDEINSVVAYIRSFEDNPVILEGRATVQGDPKLGKALFARNCAQCHGEFAQGGNGPAIGKKGFLNAVSDGFIFTMVRLGRPGSEMKAFTLHGDGFSDLSEKDVSDIISFLRSDLNTADKHSKIVRGVPERGQRLFERSCAQCHGTEGRGGIAPDLNSGLFMEAVSDSYLQATMALGRHNTQMRSVMKGGGGVVEFTSQDVNDIISYLKTLVQKDAQRR